MASVALDGVGKVFPDGTVAVGRVDLTIGDGELVALLGPSGCGKTTALRILAGFEPPTSGHVRIDGKIVDDLSVQERELAMLFQDTAVYPHLSVADNLGFPLRMAHVDRRVIRRRVAAVAAEVGLSDALDRRPRQLSGGERQRVALGRAIIRQPSILLMDEPMSNVDAKLRIELRAQLSMLQRRLGITCLLVTHDQVEAMSLGQRVAVMRAGEIVHEKKRKEWRSAQGELIEVKELKKTGDRESEKVERELRTKEEAEEGIITKIITTIIITID